MIPEFVSKLFWDVKKESVDTQKHSLFIIRRVLDYGDAASLAWLRKTYSENLIKKVIQSKRGLQHKTLIFWEKYYENI
ncbi:hypothetical protein KAW18_08300 [candidate division WOR-3 bacterium]|nr:hypothetical protein [candidate division WOR-3 bacterium]